MGIARNIARLVPNGSGELPTANIAANAITSAKISNGEVSADDLASTLNLTSKTVTLPPSIASKVLQIRWVTQQTSETVVNNGSTFDFTTISITPQSNSSTILILGNPMFYTRASDGGTSGQGNGQLFIRDVTNSTNLLIQEWINYSDNTVTHGLRQRHFHVGFFSNTVTTQRQFLFRYNQSSGVGRIGGDGNVTATIAIEFV
jgi:hypothetical protein